MPFPDHTPTFPVLLRTLAERFGDKPWIVANGERLTYAEAEARSAELARGLLADGVGKGSYVGMLMPNGVDWVLTLFALARIGALAVPINTFYQIKELLWTLRHSDVSTVLSYARFLSHDYLERFEAALPGLADRSGDGPLYLTDAPYLRSIRVWGECDRKWARGGGDELLRLARDGGIDADYLREVEDCVTPADPMIMIYSSGSTSDPKGAVHTHGTIVRHGYNLTHAFGFQPDDVLFSPMPFFWVGGLMTSVMCTANVGACLVTQDHFEAGATLDLIEAEGVTYVMGWPHYGKSMANHPSFGERDLSRIRRSNMTDLLTPEMRPRDPLLRANSLGMTETCGPHSNHDPTEDLPEELRGTFGRALDGVEHRVVHPETGAVLDSTERGEVCVRGYSRMERLHKVEREDTFDPDGFYHTGDGGFFNSDGWLFFTGRLGEMIKTGGANVTPGEVEAALSSYDEVSEAYVTGIPDEERGQLVAAAVVAKASATIDGEELRQRLKRDLSAYKVPRHIYVWPKERLPFTDSGKIKKLALAEMLAREADGG